MAKASRSNDERMTVPPPDRATLALLEESLGQRSDLRPGKMFGCPGFFLATKAVAVVFGDRVSMTLPPERIAKLIEHEGYEPFVAGGRTMSGWVLIDVERFSSLSPEAPLFDEAVAYVKQKAARAAAKAGPAQKRKRT